MSTTKAIARSTRPGTTEESGATSRGKKTFATMSRLSTRLCAAAFTLPET